MAVVSLEGIRALACRHLWPPQSTPKDALQELGGSTTHQEGVQERKEPQVWQNKLRERIKLCWGFGREVHCGSLGQINIRSFLQGWVSKDLLVCQGTWEMPEIIIF